MFDEDNQLAADFKRDVVVLFFADGILAICFKAFFAATLGMKSTFCRVFMITGASGGRSTPSRAQYSSLSRSGSLKRKVKTLFLYLVFAAIWD